MSLSCLARRGFPTSSASVLYDQLRNTKSCNFSRAFGSCPGSQQRRIKFHNWNIPERKGLQLRIWRESSTTGSGSPGLSNQVLQTTLSESGKKSEGKQGGAEDEEERKRQENAARALRYTLYGLGSMIVGSAVYGFFVWGAPLRDIAGNEIKDEFSDLSFFKQYYSRTLSELSNYITFLQEPSREKLLPDPFKFPYVQPPYTLLLEITGVLVHPDWTYKTGWRFKKRPGVDYFLKQLAGSQLFEIVIYTQESGFTAYPIVEALDSQKVVVYQLFRDSTKYVEGQHLKDLDRINRDLSKVIMVDCNPASVKSHRDNAIVLPRWLGNEDDRTLFDLAALLQTISMSEVGDVREVLAHYSNFSDPIAEFREKTRLFAEQEQERERMLVNLKHKTPGVSPPTFSFIPSFLRRS